MKRLDRNTLSCKFGRHFNDWVPEPFGSGNCAMPGFDCEYNGTVVIPEDFECDESPKCPAWQPVETKICEKHDEEYYMVCGACEDEAEKRMEEAEMAMEAIRGREL